MAVPDHPDHATHGRAERPHAIVLEQQGQVAGGHVLCLEVMEAFLAAGFRVTAGLPFGGGMHDIARSRLGDAVEIVETPPVPGRDAAAWRALSPAHLLHALRLWSRLRTGRPPDLVHVNGGCLFPTMPWLVPLLRPSRVLYYVMVAQSPGEFRLLRLLLRRQPQARLLTASRFLHQLTIEHVGEDLADRVSPVECALGARFVDLPWRRPGETAPNLRVALIGRICPEKGHELFLSVARRLPDVQFYVIGEAAPEHRPFRDRLMRRRPPNVAFVGFTLDLPGLIDELGISVSMVPSAWQEGFGLVFIESMAMSLLTMASRRGALPGLAERTGGLTFDTVEEAVSLLQWIARMSPEDRATMSRRQYDAVRATFDPARFRRDLVRAAAPPAPARAAHEKKPPGPRGQAAQVRDRMKTRSP